MGKRRISGVGEDSYHNQPKMSRKEGVGVTRGTVFPGDTSAGIRQCALVTKVPPSIPHTREKRVIMENR